jgi:hypothetical protein
MSSIQMSGITARVPVMGGAQAKTGEGTGVFHASRFPDNHRWLEA